MPPPPLTAGQLAQFHEQGFVIVRAAFAPERIEQLRVAVEGICRRAAEAEDVGDKAGPQVAWLNREKRFPARMGDWLHPTKYDPAFGEWMALDCMDHLEQLLGGPTRHCRFQMLASGDGQPYKQHWHRDWGSPESVIGLPKRARATDYSRCCAACNGLHVEWNTPLLPGERFLHVVPSSHNRPNRPAETARMGGGFVNGEDETRTDAMPGAVVVEMEPGDVCYFDAGIIHRGWNAGGIDRWTMHNVSWAADIPCMSDYDPVSSAPELEELMRTQALPPRFEGYLRAFTDDVKRTAAEVVAGGVAREPSFLDLWLEPDETDRRKAEADTATAVGEGGRRSASRL
eukprot:SAG11_NODE_1646_length_4523_cov_1.447559_2_plen_343_part_00